MEYTQTADVKDQIELTGNDVGAVSLTASQIRQSCNITKRSEKVLDGIFVVEGADAGAGVECGL